MSDTSRTKSSRDFFTNDYDNGAAFVVLAHLSEQNNHPEIARREAEKALGQRGGLFQNRVLVAVQSEVLPPIRLLVIYESAVH